MPVLRREVKVLYRAAKIDFAGAETANRAFDSGVEDSKPRTSPPQGRLGRNNAEAQRDE